MTIQKALRSGKPFRRKYWSTLPGFKNRWFVHQNDIFEGEWQCDGDIRVTPTDILANDWEIKNNP